jgi:hypothetical protein
VCRLAFWREYYSGSAAFELMIFRLWLRLEWGCAFPQSLEEVMMPGKIGVVFREWHILFYFSRSLRLQIMGLA